MTRSLVAATVVVVLGALGVTRPGHAAGGAGDAAEAVARPRTDEPSVAPLVEDNAHTLLPLLTNPTGDPGEGHVEQQHVFAGKSAVKIVPMQRFHPQIPGWNYRIVEKPGPGEYRHVRWAWKADGCVGTMVQFHMETGWSIRYCAGQNDPGWGTKFVAEKPPTGGWVVVTRDLFADFGACTITGIAMAAFQGRAGYFDHVYFGRTVDDLDRVDATGLRDGPPVELNAAARERAWAQLSSVDASKAYLAFWTLVADRGSVTFLRDKLAAAAAGPTPEQLRRWVEELNHDDFKVRDTASERLADHIDAAADLLKQELDAEPPPEARARIEILLKGRNAAAAKPDPLAKAIRVVEYVGGREAVECLEALANGAATPTATAEAAKAALARVEARRERGKAGDDNPRRR